MQGTPQQEANHDIHKKLQFNVAETQSHGAGSRLSVATPNANDSDRSDPTYGAQQLSFFRYLELFVMGL